MLERLACLTTILSLIALSWLIGDIFEPKVSMDSKNFGEIVVDPISHRIHPGDHIKKSELGIPELTSSLQDLDGDLVYLDQVAASVGIEPRPYYPTIRIEESAPSELQPAPQLESKIESKALRLAYADFVNEQARHRALLRAWICQRHSMSHSQVDLEISARLAAFLIWGDSDVSSPALPPLLPWVLGGALPLQLNFDGNNLTEQTVLTVVPQLANLKLDEAGQYLKGLVSSHGWIGTEGEGERDYMIRELRERFLHHEEFQGALAQKLMTYTRPLLKWMTRESKDSLITTNREAIKSFDIVGTDHLLFVLLPTEKQKEPLSSFETAIGQTHWFYIHPKDLVERARMMPPTDRIVVIGEQIELQDLLALERVTQRILFIKPLAEGMAHVDFTKYFANGTLFFADRNSNLEFTEIYIPALKIAERRGLRGKIIPGQGEWSTATKMLLGFSKEEQVSSTNIYRMISAITPFELYRKSTAHPSL